MLQFVEIKSDESNAQRHRDTHVGQLRQSQLTAQTNSSSTWHDRSFDPERHVWFTACGRKRNERANRNCQWINELRLAEILCVQDFLIGQEADLPTEYGVIAAAADRVLNTFNDGGLDYTRAVSRATPRASREQVPKPEGSLDVRVGFPEWRLSRRPNPAHDGPHVAGALCDWPHRRAAVSLCEIVSHHPLGMAGFVVLQ